MSDHDDQARHATEREGGTPDLAGAVDSVARAELSGVVRVDAGDGGVVFERAYGHADRAHGVANTFETRFAIASGTKGFTALTVMALVERGALALDTTARSLLGDDLPLIADDVTVEHLLSHRSGIGDYLDEEELDVADDYVLPVPVHRLATAQDYLSVLDGHPTVFPAGERAVYNNGAFVVLALMAERAATTPYHDLVHELVVAPAGLTSTGFLRSDEVPGDVALGYVGDGLRTNVLHLPVLGVGDGGIFTTVADMRTFWTSLFAGRIVSSDTLATMLRPLGDQPGESYRYGLGLLLSRDGGSVVLVGGDAGISFHSVHQPDRDVTHTVVSNTADGAWPVARELGRHLGPDPDDDATEEA